MSNTAERFEVDGIRSTERATASPIEGP